MATQNQKNKLYSNLKKYQKRYLQKQYKDLDESATRIMVNSFLTDVLGYKELEDIKTEYRIKGEYADYVIQLARKKHLIVEVKAIQLDLSEKHLRQSVNYAANEGIDWILLINGRQIELFRVIFGKPIDIKKIFKFNLDDKVELKESLEFLFYLTKGSVLKGELEVFWKRFQVLEPKDLSKNFYSIEVVRFLRKVLKNKSGLFFSEEDILDSVYRVITTKIDSNKPKVSLDIFKNKKLKIKKEKVFEEDKDVLNKEDGESEIG